MERYINKELRDMSWKEYSDDFDLNMNDPDLDGIEDMMFGTNIKEKAMVATAPAKDPLKEIDNYIDAIGVDITKAVGNLNDRELRI